MGVIHTREFWKGKLEGYNEAWDMVQIMLPKGYTLKPAKLRHAIAALNYKINRILREDTGKNTVEKYMYPKKETG